ncbi:MAG TPA: type II toxin-antitoxin system VapC family toxin [Candidatus Xenobia bacterium]|jgi:PIN domain nuclease of toxin-antitoxin system
MRLLLDTQVVLWAMVSPQRLPLTLTNQLEEGDTEVYVSVASCWEIAIKYALGKLALPDEPAVYLPPQFIRHGMVPLPVGLTHALAVGAMPPHHNDPFDRLIIAQATIETLHTVTSDRKFVPYGIPLTLI